MFLMVKYDDFCFIINVGRVDEDSSIVPTQLVS